MQRGSSLFISLCQHLFSGARSHRNESMVSSIGEPAAGCSMARNCGYIFYLHPSGLQTNW